LGNGLVEKLLGSAETTEEETHSHDKEKIGEDTANKRGLNNDDFILGKGNNCNNHFNSVSGLC
jgi:hypothetical protein